MIPEVILWHLARRRVRHSRPQRPPLPRRRPRRALDRLDRRRATGDAPPPPVVASVQLAVRRLRRIGPSAGPRLGVRLTAHRFSRLSLRSMLAGRYDEAADLARRGLEVTGPQRTDRGSLLAAAPLHGYVALAAMLGGGDTGAPRLDVVVMSRTNRATATCDAPNCAGHRVRA